MIKNELLNNDPYIVPEHAPIIILDNESAVCISKNGKETKHTRHIFRRMHVVRNGGYFNYHNKMWCEGGLQLVDIGTKNVRGDELNPRLGYYVVRLDNSQNTCKTGVTGYRRV